MIGTSRQGLAVTMTFLGIVFAVSCATNPMSGKTELTLLSESQEIAMGRQGAADVAATIGVNPECRFAGICAAHRSGAGVEDRAPHASVGLAHRR